MRRYRVNETITDGVTVRSGPHSRTAVVSRLYAGDTWSGDEVTGARFYVPGLGSSNVWVRRDDGRCVWRGYLVEMP